ncbi:12281_t:CDS:2, partial [Cetraspora pellucida]
NNSRRFSTTTVAENSDSEYSDSEYNNSKYSDPELLIYKLENSNKANFDNEKTELNEEEAKQLIYKNSSFYDLRWDNKASGGQLLYYSDDLKCTQQCKNKELWKAAQGSMTNNNSISEQLNTLNNRLKDTKNMNAYKYLCLLAVHKYLNAIFSHEELQSCIELSLEISQQVFQCGPWMAYHIREQEQRKYTQTLIDDEDVQSSCLHYIRTIGVYYDGHECPDVVQYRSIFLEKMKNFEFLMPQFVGENMNITINPEISKEQRIHIFVTYNECTFYANDVCPSVWAPLGMLPLYKKGMGKALMISEFLTETRGHLTITFTEI